MKTLYDPKWIGRINATGMLCLVLGQTRLIYDATGLIHDTWHVAWRWVLSAGFEGVILGSALTRSMTRDKDTDWGESFVIAMSIGAGVAVGLYGQPLDDYSRVALVVALGLVPVQYAVAIRAGRALTRAHYPDIATGPTSSATGPASIAPLCPACGHRSHVGDCWQDTTQAWATSAPETTAAETDRPELLDAFLRHNASGLTNKQLAEILGVNVRTISRLRTRATAAGLLPAAGTPVHTNGHSPA